MIQTQILNDRGEKETLDHNDPRYWEGPYVYTPYPKDLYRQTQPGQPCEIKTVHNEQEHTRLGSDWHEPPADAATHFQRLESDIAKAAAERNYSDRLMSAKAIAEALQVDRATDSMVPDVPSTPIRKKPGPKPKPDVQ